MSKSFSSLLCPSCADSPQNKSKRPEPGLSSFNLRETNFLHHKWESLDTTQLFTSMENPSQESMTAALLLYMPLDPTLSLPGLKIEDEQTLLSKNIEQNLASALSEKRSPSVPLAVVAQYLAGAFLNLLKWWLESEMPYSPKRMDEMFQQLALPGVWANVGESWKGM